MLRRSTGAWHGPADDEVSTAKNQLIGGHLLGLDGNASLADTLVGFWLDGHWDDALEQRRDAILRVSHGDVSRLASTLLYPRRDLVTVVGIPGL